MKTALIPTDFSAASHRIIDAGLSFLLDSGHFEKVILLNTYTLPSALPSRLVEIHDELKQKSLQGLQEELARIRSRNGTNGIAFETQSYLGALENVLPYVVREQGVDCVVLGLVSDSKVSEEAVKTLQRISCPAWIIPGSRP